MTMRQITFKEFSKLMAKRRRSVDDLVDLFRGKFEDPRSFFERVFAQRWRNPETGRYDDRGDVVIPYRSVIEFYIQESQHLKDSEEGKEALALKRKRGPVTEEQRQVLIERLRKARAAKVTGSEKSGGRAREIIEEVM